MAGFGDIVQKALYLGVGLAAYAGEKAGGKLAELRTQAQKLADELVARGEMNTEEARRFVDDLMKQAQQPTGPTPSPNPDPPVSEPRRIEILSEDEEPTPNADVKTVEDMRKHVDDLQE